MSQVKIQAIDALAEFDRCGWTVVPATNNEVKIKCPHPEHNDNDPSASFNLDSNKWKCFGCDAKGDIITFLSYATNVQRATVIQDLIKRYPNMLGVKTFNRETVEKQHIALWEQKHLLEELYKRGITDEYIRERRLGYYNNRIMIPVADSAGNIVGNRMYLPGAPGHQKMKNAPGYSKPLIYLIDQVEKYQELWFCGGELKAGAAIQYLNKINVGAFALTAGEGKGWNNEHINKIKGKDIYICMDIDTAGLRASQTYAKLLSPHANSVRIISLPLDPEKHPKGDINDWIHTENPSHTDFADLMKEASKFQSAAYTVEDDTPVIEVSLAEATNPAYFKKKIRTEGILTALGESTYFVPSKVKALCDKAQNGCGMCPIYSLPEDKDGSGISLELNTCNQYYLAMVGNKDSIVDMLLKEALGIPRCKSVVIQQKERVKLVEVRLSPKLKIGEETKTSGTTRAFIVGKEIPELGNIYNFTGSLFSSPKDQTVSLVFNDLELSDTSLNSYDPSEDDLRKLKVFQPDSWTLEDLSKKIEEIYLDFAANITHIHNRLDLHLTIDLTYHSVLMFELKGSEQIGWINSLIIGDSSQGKSATATALKAHYGLGEKVDCKNATVAGLIGGLQQIQKTWFISWGIIPSNDRGMVFLEEFKGLNKSTIGSMTDMRSSGIVEIPKIEKDKAYARTRLCALTNARENKFMSEFSYGTKAIESLVGNPEDIRRFDLAIVVANEQVDSDVIGQAFSKEQKYDHKHTKSLCKELILFAWTRTKKQVIFQKEALEMVNTLASELGSKFCSKFPLLDTGTTRKKISRLAIALAVRTFSVTKGLESVLVRPCHIQYIGKFLTRVYSDKFFGYDRFSSDFWRANTIPDKSKVTELITSSEDPLLVVDLLTMSDTITLADLQDIFGFGRDQAQMMLSKFVRLNCLKRTGPQEYTKTTEFTELLKGGIKWERRQSDESEIPF